MSTDWKNNLYYGENMKILRDFIPDESVDLIYLDPPFNSKATYNILFKEQDGKAPASQVQTFEDTWHWNQDTEYTYQEIIREGPEKIAALIQSLHNFLGPNDMMAYLTLMAIRLVELGSVLKSTGSIYLHCDPTASHYIKLVMDGHSSFSRQTAMLTEEWNAKLSQQANGTLLSTAEVDFSTTGHP